MSDETITIALKEWAVVQRALLESKQIMLLRKGGLIEETGEFDLRSNRFLIQPTYIHETERAGDIRPQYLGWLRDEESRRTPDGLIRFECLCDVASVVKVPNAESILALGDKVIWSEKFIRARFDWEPYKPVFAIIVRAYKLMNPVTLEAKASYSGCKSWIDLEETISISEARPVIEDENQFADKLRQMTDTLKNP